MQEVSSPRVFLYSAVHMSAFGAPHLKGGAWYLDCRPGFIPPRKEALLSSLFNIAPVEAVADKEKAAQSAQVEKLNRARRKKAKDGTATKPAT